MGKGIYTRIPKNAIAAAAMQIISGNTDKFINSRKRGHGRLSIVCGLVTNIFMVGTWVRVELPAKTPLVLVNLLIRELNKRFTYTEKLTGIKEHYQWDLVAVRTKRSIAIGPRSKGYLNTTKFGKEGPVRKSIATRK